MSGEGDLIARLRELATHPAARGLLDDAAVLPAPVGRDLVFTHDMLVEGVHFLPTCPAGDVAWKLLAVNLSDLAAKGAIPIGVLMGYGLTGDAGWDAAFVDGLARALAHFDVPLLGGDTVSQPIGQARALGLTAIGTAPAGCVPDRRGAKAGDQLWVTGPIGDAGLGLRIALGEIEGPRRLLKAYRLPMPRLVLGRALAPHVSAMADVSDGLLIDARRIAVASNLAVTVDLAAVPLSGEARSLGLDPLTAATAGDDYQLLFASSSAEIERIASEHRVAIARVGRFDEGSGLVLLRGDTPVDLPSKLGWEHGA